VNDVVIDSVIKTITLQGVGTLWFLPVLLLGEVLFFMAKKVKLNDFSIILIGIIAVILSSYLNSKGICGLYWYGSNTLYGLTVNNPATLFLSGCITLMFIEIGYVTYKFFPHYFNGDINKGSRIATLCVICMVAVPVDYMFVGQYAGDLHKLNIGNPWIYFICSISGIVFVCTLSMLIGLCFKKSSIFNYWGKNSLIIMTTHTEYYINSIANLLLISMFSQLNIAVDNKTLSGLSLALIMIMEIGIVFLINHSYLRYIYTLPKRRAVSN